MRQYADKRFRLTRRDDISRLFEQGHRNSDRLITIFALPSEPRLDHCRLGVAVSKRHGNAPQRNRIKRLCREAFRLTRSSLPCGWDFMIVPRLGGDLTVERLQTSIRSLAARLIHEAPMKDSRK